MIKYNSGLFGFQILLRLHGSAAFKALTPSVVSCAIFILLYYYSELQSPDDVILGHPYPVGALVSALTFLLAFRANFSYNRYWEAVGAVHHMHSKWLDVGIELAAFHLQAAQYKNIKPPAFGENPDLTCLERERERLNVTTLQQLEEQLHQDQLEQKRQEKENANNNQQQQQRRRYWRVVSWKRKRRGQTARETTTARKNKNQTNNGKEDGDNGTTTPLQQRPPPPPPILLNPQHHHQSPRHQYKSINRPYDPATVDRRHRRHKRQRELGPRIPFPPFSRHPSGPSLPPTKTTIKTVKPTSTSSLRISSNSNHLTNNNNNKKNKIPLPKHEGPARNIHAAWDPELPPLFLQEAAHLLSLLSAVSMSTLRNDLEQADSPLIAFRPGAPWPHVDPDDYGADVRKDWDATRHRSWAILRYVLGVSRTPESRTLYNAARPFRVIGGVSDAEIQLLQAARGPLAKVALCTMWLQEFMSREYLAGSTGNVAPPIISRLFQFVSDGMLGYNQARKVAYTPFPFPHAQITSLFVLIVVAVMPVLMLTYVRNVLFSFLMNLLTVLCFSGLHEVARELESPFQNAPNDVPLNYFQAQFNEALLTMFAGYHPDAYWEVCETVQEPPPASPIPVQKPAAVKPLQGTGEVDADDDDDDDDEENGDDRGDAIVGNLLGEMSGDDDDDDDDFRAVSSFAPVSSKDKSRDDEPFESKV